MCFDSRKINKIMRPLFALKIRADCIRTVARGDSSRSGQNFRIFLKKSDCEINEHALSSFYTSAFFSHDCWSTIGLSGSKLFCRWVLLSKKVIGDRIYSFFNRHSEICEKVSLSHKNFIQYFFAMIIRNKKLNE